MKKSYVAVALSAVLMFSTANVSAKGKNGIAAVVNGKDIKVADLKSAYEINPELKKKVKFADFYKKTLDVFVDGELVYQAAIEDKVTESPEYKRDLKLAQQEIARKIYLDKQIEKLVNDDKLKEVYADYKKAFKPQKEVKAKHILVSNEKKAKEVIAKLNKKGNFDKLAKEYSKEPADLGYFTKEVMVPEFAKAAFELKKGQYTKSPVKTQFGYHIIKVEDIRDSKPLEFEKIKPQLKGMLAQGAVGKVISDINKKAKIIKYDLKGNEIK